MTQKYQTPSVSNATQVLKPNPKIQS